MSIFHCPVSNILKQNETLKRSLEIGFVFYKILQVYKFRISVKGKKTFAQRLGVDRVMTQLEPKICVVESRAGLFWLDSSRFFSWIGLLKMALPESKILILVNLASQNESENLIKFGKIFLHFYKFLFKTFLLYDKKLEIRKILGSFWHEPIFSWLEQARAQKFCGSA